MTRHWHSCPFSANHTTPSFHTPLPSTTTLTTPLVLSGLTHWCATTSHGITINGMQTLAALQLSHRASATLPQWCLPLLTTPSTQNPTCITVWCLANVLLLLPPSSLACTLHFPNSISLCHVFTHVCVCDHGIHHAFAFQWCTRVGMGFVM